jgi:hypothetical protein
MLERAGFGLGPGLFPGNAHNFGLNAGSSLIPYNPSSPVQTHAGPTLSLSH